MSNPSVSHDSPVQVSERVLPPMNQKGQKNHPAIRAQSPFLQEELNTLMWKDGPV